MNTKGDDVVSASEIASWAFCPESWRLAAVGKEPDNREAIERGEALHERTAALEVSSRRLAVLGRRLLVLALVVAVLLYALFGGAD